MKKILAVASPNSEVFPMFKAIESEYEIIYLDRMDIDGLETDALPLDDFISKLIGYNADFIIIDTCFCIWFWSNYPSCGQGFYLSKRILKRDSSQKIIGITCHADHFEKEERYKGHGMIDVIHYYGFSDEIHREDEVKRIISRLKGIEEQF